MIEVHVYGRGWPWVQSIHTQGLCEITYYILTQSKNICDINGELSLKTVVFEMAAACAWLTLRLTFDLDIRFITSITIEWLTSLAN